MTDVIKVRATRRGQIKVRNSSFRSGFEFFWKNPGDEFFIEPEQMSSWMEVVSSAGQSATPEPAEDAAPQEALSEVNDPLARIRAALEKLDPNNDEHWTKAGDPAMAAVEEILGDTSVTRDEVKAADPGFNRTIAAERA